MTPPQESSQTWAGWPPPLKLILLLVGAGVLYVLLVTQHYVGFFNDDALYVLSALSLLKGRFVTLCLPQEPPMTHFLPGYPLSLAPFVFWVQPHWAWLKLTSVCWTLGSGLTLWLLARRFMSEGFSLLVVGAYLFNPTVVEFSSVVMPEPFLVLMMGWVWILLIRLIEHETPAATWSFAGVLAWSCWIRHEAILLAVCIAGAFLYAKRPSLAIKTVTPAVLCWGLVLLRNLWAAGSPTDYLPYWSPGPGGLAKWGLTLPLQFLRRWDALFVPSIAGLSLAPHSLLRMCVAPLVMCCGTGLTAYGIFRTWKRMPSDRPFLWALSVFLLSYAAVHAVWYVYDVRYALPVLPFIWLFILIATQALWGRFRFLRWFFCVLLGLVLLGYADRISYAVYRTRAGSGPGYRTFPQGTLEWVRQHIPEGVRIMSNKIETIFLYTGRQGYFIQTETGPIELRNRLLSQGAHYVVIRPEPSLDKALEQSWQKTMLWMAEHTELFTLVYLNRAEQTFIFEVRK